MTGKLKKGRLNQSLNYSAHRIHHNFNKEAVPQWQTTSLLLQAEHDRPDSAAYANSVLRFPVRLEQRSKPVLECVVQSMGDLLPLIAAVFVLGRVLTDV